MYDMRLGGMLRKNLLQDALHSVLRARSRLWFLALASAPCLWPKDKWGRMQDVTNTNLVRTRVARRGRCCTTPTMEELENVGEVLISTDQTIEIGQNNLRRQNVDQDGQKTLQNGPRGLNG